MRHSFFNFCLLIFRFIFLRSLELFRKKDSLSFADKFIFQNNGKDALVYIVSFKDMDTRNKSWDSFINDPEWISVFEESRKDGPIVREIEQVFLSPTIFSNLN